MTKILHLTLSLNVGGRERVIVNLSNNLLKEGFISSICCLRKSGVLSQYLNDRIKVFEVFKKHRVDLSIIKQLKDYLKSNNISIIHCHNPGTLFYGLIAAKWAKTPSIISTEHGFSNKILWRGRLKESMLYRYVDEIIAVSENLKELMIENYKISPEKITLLPNGSPSAKVNENKYNSRRTLGMPENIFNIGIIARLDPVKNHKMLLDAIYNIVKNKLSVHLWIVGSGKEKEKIEKETKRLEIEEYVSLLGERNDVPIILNALDCLVLSSFSEGFPVTILEAMSAGLPIIATDVGGNREIIKNGRSGILVKSNSSEELAKAIISLMKDRKLREKIGLTAKQQFEKYYSMEKMIVEMTEIYRRALI